MDGQVCNPTSYLNTFSAITESGDELGGMEGEGGGVVESVQSHEIFSGS